MHHLSTSNYRFSGTIVGIEDNNSSGWADSEWRSLKVNFFFLQILTMLVWSKNVFKASEVVGIPWK